MNYFSTKLEDAKDAKDADDVYFSLMKLVSGEFKDFDKQLRSKHDDSQKKKFR